MTHAIEGIVSDNRVHASRDTNERRDASRPPAPLASPAPPTQPADPKPVAQHIVLPELHAAFDGAAADADAAPVLRDWNPLHQIKATLEVCVGEARLTVGELLAARENQVLRLDRTLDQAVDLTIEGKVVARGQLVALEDHFAVRITELPHSLGLAPGA